VNGSVDFLSDWVTSEQNWALADHTVFADGDDLDTVSSRVAQLVTGR